MVSTGVVIDSNVYADAMISFPRLTFSLAALVSCVAKLDPCVFVCVSRQSEQLSSLPLPLLMHDSAYIALHPISNVGTV